VHYNCTNEFREHELIRAAGTSAETIPPLVRIAGDLFALSDMHREYSEIHERSRMYAMRHRQIVASSRLLAYCCLVIASSARAQPAVAKIPLRIALVASASPPSASAAARGVRLGAAEAKQTANLFGSDVDLYEASAGNDAAATAAQMLSQRQVQVLIGTSAADADALSRFAELHHLVFFNIASRAQPLRAGCRRYTFHIEATDAMYANAARSLAIGGGSTHTGQSPERPDSVVLWGPALERYGASQINDRYRTRYGSGMDGSAWAGWVAVKIASEAALRVRSSEPAKLLTYLEAPTTQFDGHKGWPLSFRAGDHQLRQPLYVVVHRAQGVSGPASQALRDVPELRSISSAPDGANEGRRASEALDRLISGPTASRCFSASH
jgi:ABC-type branched-subunit amino acid transport system substrate-binding protein